jgi:hypothetical protein
MGTQSLSGARRGSRNSGVSYVSALTRGAVLSLMLGAAISAADQSSEQPSKPKAARPRPPNAAGAKWVPPRTPWGDIDLRGTWAGGAFGEELRQSITDRGRGPIIGAQAHGGLDAAIDELADLSGLPRVQRSRVRRRSRTCP